MIYVQKYLLQKKNINVKPFNMMTNKDEPKAMAEHISTLPNNFSDFCFVKCNNTCSALHFCCHLHLPRKQIMVDL